MKHIQYLLLLSGLLACNPAEVTTQTDQEGVVTQLPHVWKSSISDGKVRSTGLYHGYIIDNRGVLAMAVRKTARPGLYSDSYLQLKDLETGENIWTWDEFHNQSAGSLHNSIGLYPNMMLVHDGPYDYAINTNSGTTIWKKDNMLHSATPYPAFLDQKFYFTANGPTPASKNRVEDGVFVGDVNTGEISELTVPKYSEEYSVSKPGLPYYVGSLIRIEAFKKDNMDYLVVPHVEMGPNIKYNDNRAYFGLYNITQKKWVYERIPLNYPDEGTSTSLKPIVDGDLVYLTSLNSLACFEVMTGKQVWQRKVTDDYTGFNYMIKVGDKLLINGDNATLYCLNAATGSVLWTQKASIITSDLYQQDGVVYYIYTKYLLAVDINSGKLLWDMPSPDIKWEKRGDSWFAGFVAGIPGKDGKKGKIFASTNYNVYCFEAAK